MKTTTIDISWIVERKINTLNTLSEGTKIELYDGRTATFKRMKRAKFIAEMDGKLYDIPFQAFGKVFEEKKEIVVANKEEKLNIINNLYKNKVNKKNVINVNCHPGGIYCLILDTYRNDNSFKEKCSGMNLIIPEESRIELEISEIVESILRLTPEWESDKVKTFPITLHSLLDELLKNGIVK